MSKRISPGNIKLKRAYEHPAAEDGTRILIDRLWPRGVKKEAAAIDQWVREGGVVRYEIEGVDRYIETFELELGDDGSLISLSKFNAR